VQVQDAPCCDYPRDTRPFLFAESGALMAGAARTAINAGLTGLEWAVSVPGSVGGAVVNNAGAHGGEVKDCLWDVLLLDDSGDIQIYRVEDLAYAYRQSSLKRGAITDAGFGPVLLSANFRLDSGERETIRRTAQAFLSHRRDTQPVEPSLGSTFVNPPGDFAGRLIEEAGLKGFRLGGVEVSCTHANFLINPGGVGAATAADVMAMIEHIQTTVARGSGVALEPELQKLGDW
jgi:UDP-N-acetylmuramate dehydrogenase